MISFRPARTAEAETLRRIAAAAYKDYVPRIGRAPAPMTADYGAAIRCGQAWVAVGMPDRPVGDAGNPPVSHYHLERTSPWAHTATVGAAAPRMAESEHLAITGRGHQR